MAEYEIVLKEFLPLLKRDLAVVMSKEHGMRQEQIAKLLGVTQAEVSKYINGDQPKGIGIKVTYTKKDLEKLIGMLMNEQHYESQKIVCKICPKGSVMECSLMIK
jgi:hypothetical protein